jgi:hypothetical protein
MSVSGHSGKKRLSIRTVVLMVMPLVGHVPKPALAADPANFVFVASRDRAEVAIIDSLTNEVARRLPLPAVPGDMTPLARGRLLAGVHPSLRQVTVVDVTNGNIAQTVQVPVRPDAVRADPTGTALAVLDHGSGKIAVVTVATDQVRLIPNITDAVYVVFDARQTDRGASVGGSNSGYRRTSDRRTGCRPRRWAGDECRDRSGRRDGLYRSTCPRGSVCFQPAHDGPDRCPASAGPAGTGRSESRQPVRARAARHAVDCRHLELDAA